jgi:hypothetical protein
VPLSWRRKREKHEKNYPITTLVEMRIILELPLHCNEALASTNDGLKDFELRTYGGGIPTTYSFIYGWVAGYFQP